MGTPLADKRPGPEVLLLIHGTAVPVDPNQSAKEPAWYESGSHFVEQLRQQIGASTSLEVQSFLWSGDNLESSRQKSADRLLAKLRDLEETRCGYHIVAHSHGGSVLWLALRNAQAAHAVAGRWWHRRLFDTERSNRTAAPPPLPGLRSWTTVGTPFLHFQPVVSPLLTTLVFLLACLLFYSIGSEWWAWLRGSGLEFSSPSRIVATSISHAWADGSWGRLLLFGLLGTSALFILALGLSLLRDPAREWSAWRRVYRDRAAQNAWTQFGPRWLGLHVPQDEALRALQHTLQLDGRIIPGQFLRTEKLGDNFIWAMLSARSQGNDTRYDRVVAVTPAPFLGLPRWPQLPTSELQDLMNEVTTSSTDALQKLRAKLFDNPEVVSKALAEKGPASPIGLFWDFLSQLNWGELFHTSYFPTAARPKFDATVRLVAAHIQRFAPSRVLPPTTQPASEPIMSGTERTVIGAPKPGVLTDWYDDVAKAYQAHFCPQPKNNRSDEISEDRPAYGPIIDPLSIQTEARNPYRSLHYAWKLALAILLLASGLGSSWCLHRVTPYSDEYQIDRILKDLPGLLGRSEPLARWFASSQPEYFYPPQSGVVYSPFGGNTVSFGSMEDSVSLDLMPNRMRDASFSAEDASAGEFGPRTQAARALITLVGSAHMHHLWKELDLAAKLRIGSMFASALKDHESRRLSTTEATALQALLTHIRRDLSIDGIERVLRDPAANRGDLDAISPAFPSPQSLNYSDGERAAGVTQREFQNRSLPIQPLCEVQLRIGTKDDMRRILDKLLQDRQEILRRRPTSAMEDPGVAQKMNDYEPLVRHPIDLAIVPFLESCIGTDEVKNILISNGSRVFMHFPFTLDDGSRAPRPQVTPPVKAKTIITMEDAITELTNKDGDPQLQWMIRHFFVEAKAKVIPAMGIPEEKLTRFPSWMGATLLDGTKRPDGTTPTDGTKPPPGWKKLIPHLEMINLLEAVDFADELDRRGFRALAAEIVKEVATTAQQKMAKEEEGLRDGADIDELLGLYLSRVGILDRFGESGQQLAEKLRSRSLQLIKRRSFTERPPWLLSLASLTLRASAPRQSELDALISSLREDVQLLGDDAPDRTDFWRIAEQVMLMRLLARDKEHQRQDVLALGSAAAGHIRHIATRNAWIRATLAAQLAAAYVDINATREASEQAIWSQAAADSVSSEADRSRVLRELTYVFANLGDLPRARHAAAACTPNDRLDAYALVVMLAARRYLESSPSGMTAEEANDLLKKLTVPQLQLWEQRRFRRAPTMRVE